MNKRRKHHNPEQIVRKLRDADAMLKYISEGNWYALTVMSKP